MTHNSPMVYIGCVKLNFSALSNSKAFSSCCVVLIRKSVHLSNDCAVTGPDNQALKQTGYLPYCPCITSYLEDVEPASRNRGRVGVHDNYEQSFWLLESRGICMVHSWKISSQLGDPMGVPALDFFCSAVNSNVAPPLKVDWPRTMIMYRIQGNHKSGHAESSVSTKNFRE